MTMRNSLFILLWFSVMSTYAQQKFSMLEAVNYGVEHHTDVKNAVVGRQDTELQIREIKQGGLPQINGQVSYAYNAIIPSQLIEAKNFNPNAAEGEVAKIKFGVPWGGQAGISLNQLIYDATFLVGLRAADTYRKLADQNIVQSKTAIAENVAKAYYSVLVAQERAQLIDLNIGRIDSLLSSTAEMYKQGFVEKIDVDRLSVQKNNLISEQTKVQNLIQLSLQLLQFQMNYDLSSKIELTDNLKDLEKEVLAIPIYTDVNPENRIEYKVLQTNKEMLGLNVERITKGAKPSFFLTGSLGASHSNITFNPFQRWFPSSTIGIAASIPIYDSGLRKTQAERQRLSIIQLDNSAEMLANSFRLQNNQAIINLKNGLENLGTQKANLSLAEEVLRVAKIKYGQGLGTNLEVVNAENDLRQSQTNYFASLYDVLVAKVDLDKAQGNLIKE